MTTGELPGLCYGMLYGIGNKALGESLELTEEEAAQFVENFKDRSVYCTCFNP